MLGNMFIAVVFGTFTLVALIFMLFFLIEAWFEIRAIRCKQVFRFFAGAAICGLVGALIMQAFGLWIT